MTEDRARGTAGTLREQPDPLDVWFRWVAGAATAALIGFCLISVFQAEPAGEDSAAHYHPHVVG